MAVEVLVPPLGTNVDTVTLVTWYKREGDDVAQGEPLFAVETDKAVLDVEAPGSGYLRGVSAAEGDELPALSRIAWLCAPGEAPAAVARHTVESVLPVLPGRGAHRPARGSRACASPWARTLAAERGVDWAALRGTGPSGAVVARDVHAAAPTAPRPPRMTPLAARIARDVGLDAGSIQGTGGSGRVTREDVVRAAQEARDDDDVAETFYLAGIRGRIADRMLRGATGTASVTLTAEADATGLVAARKRYLDGGLNVSYNDLLIEIVATALRDHPRLNATCEGDRVTVRRGLDIALAVDTDRGLLAPVIRGVQNMVLPAIASATAGVVERARNGMISPDELRGSTFTVTNLGMFGIDAFTPIINLPECAVLGVGRIKPTPWAVGDRVEVRHAVWLSLTFDHRLVDGGPAARFLQAVVRAVEARG